MDQLCDILAIILIYLVRVAIHRAPTHLNGGQELRKSSFDSQLSVFESPDHLSEQGKVKRVKEKPAKCSKWTKVNRWWEGGIENKTEPQSTKMGARRPRKEVSSRH